MNDYEFYTRLKALWDIAGLGEDAEESEAVYKELCARIVRSHKCDDGSHCPVCLRYGLPDGRKWNGLAFV